MKKLMLLTIIFILVWNNVNAQNYKDEAIAARDTGSCFIKLSSDSIIVKYNTLKYKMPPMSYGYLEGDGEKLKYEVKDILCFQDEKGFWLRTAEPTKSLIGKAPFDGFFAVRICNGKIELFGQYIRNNNNSGWSYFVRKENIFTGLDTWGVNLKNMMSDNKRIYNSIDVNDRKKVKELIEIVEEYNKSK
jgi:hypothetical protein